MKFQPAIQALVISLFASAASAQQVIVSGAPRSAPACIEKVDVVALSEAIAAKEHQKVLDLTSGGRCWGIWDGSEGAVVETDTALGLAQVSFSKMARLPEGRVGTYWLSTSVLLER
jgi:hypothetical protein